MFFKTPLLRVCQNLREKRGLPKGLMQKSGKFQGVMIKLTGNPGGQLQKNWYPYNFFLEKPNNTFLHYIVFDVVIRKNVLEQSYTTLYRY